MDERGKGRNVELTKADQLSFWSRCRGRVISVRVRPVNVASARIRLVLPAD